MKKLLVPMALILVIVLSFALVACSSSTPTSTAPAVPATSEPASVPAATSAPATTTPATSVPATSAAPEVKTLNIGEIDSMTGIFSDFMKYVPQAAQVAADYINNHGGITINGQKYNINLIIDDNKSTPDGSAAAANDLMFGHNVKFICGTGPTPLVIAIDQVAEQNGVLYSAIMNNGTPGDVGPSHPLKFEGASDTFSCVLTAMTYLKQIHPEVKTITIMNYDDGSIQSLSPVESKLATELGFTMQGAIVGVIPGAVDMTPFCQTAISRNADAIMLGNMPTEAIGENLKDLRTLGYTKPIFSGSFPNGADIPAVAGNTAAEGFFCISVPSDPNTPTFPPILSQVMQTIINKYGPFNTLDFSGFNTLYTLAQAIQNAQSLDPKVVADDWSKMTTIQTLFGPGEMGGLKTYGVNHSVYFPTPISAIENGKLVLKTWIPLNQAALP